MKHLNANELKKINGGLWKCKGCGRKFNSLSWWNNFHYDTCDPFYEKKRRKFVLW